MFLHLGGQTAIRKKSIIGIFDMDTATVSKVSKDYLAAAQKGGRVKEVSFELPKSFVVTYEDGKEEIYLSPLLTQTIGKRAKFRRNGAIKYG